MEQTLGKRIAYYRKEKGMTQEELSEALGISAQAVSKWENDQTCPDVTTLPILAGLLGVTVDYLLTGETAEPSARVIPEEDRREMKDLVLHISVDSADGDRVRVNLPMLLVETVLNLGLSLPQVSGNEALKNVNFADLLTLVKQGVVGTLVEIDTAEKDTVRITVD